MIYPWGHFVEGCSIYGSHRLVGERIGGFIYVNPDGEEQEGYIISSFNGSICFGFLPEFNRFAILHLQGPMPRVDFPNAIQ